MTNTGGNIISIANCCYNGNSMEDGSFFSNVNGNNNGMRSMYLFPGGYCNLNDPTVTGTDSISYHYYNKDHLGNNREVINEQGHIEQVVHYYPFGTPFTDGSSTNIGLQPYLYGNKELDMMHGLNTYDFGARNYNPLLPMWDRVDPMCEKNYGVNPYLYCKDNPIIYSDPTGLDGVRIVNNEDSTITIKANYYVVTGSINYRDNNRNPNSLNGYSIEDINAMNEYNDYLNNLNLTVPSGDYKGYKVKFDLTFIDGGSFLDAQNGANDDYYNGNHIGNLFQRGNNYTHKNIGFEKVLLEDGTTQQVGGAIQSFNKIIMNIETDGKMNRLHEIFHSFGLEHKKGGASQGILKYPPGKPSKKDALSLSKTPFLPTIIRRQ